MAPIKFEENIKSTLEKRTIQPSRNSWDTLEKSIEKVAINGKKKTRVDYEYDH